MIRYDEWWCMILLTGTFICEPSRCARLLFTTTTSDKLTFLVFSSTHFTDPHSNRMSGFFGGGGERIRKISAVSQSSMPSELSTTLSNSNSPGRSSPHEPPVCIKWSESHLYRSTLSTIVLLFSLSSSFPTRKSNHQMIRFFLNDERLTWVIVRESCQMLDLISLPHQKEVVYICHGLVSVAWALNLTSKLFKVHIWVQ